MKRMIKATEEVSIYSDEYKALVDNMDQHEKNEFLRKYLQEDITFAMHYAEDSLDFINNAIKIYQESSDSDEFLNKLVKIFRMEK